jgi:hypothetical protein
MKMPGNEILDLKEYIKETLGEKITQLAKSLDAQGSTLRHIEITTTTNIAEVKKDIQSIAQRLEDIEKAHLRLVESQKFNWRNLQEQRAKEVEEQQKKEEEQTKVNESFKAVKGFLYLILGVCLSILAGLVMNFIQGAR